MVHITYKTILLLLVLGVGASCVSAADDEAILRDVLSDFLANVDNAATHDRFWAEDLIYTSSSGVRRGKAQIMAGFSGDTSAYADAPSYGGEDVTIRVFDDIAVVTFRLTAEEAGERVGEYFNTGVFRRNGNSWQAFTWQATHIPEPGSN